MSGNKKTTPPSSGSGSAPAGSATLPCHSCTVTLHPTPLVVCAGCTGGTAVETATAVASPTGGTVTWSRGDASIATVAGGGASATVTGVAPGATTIKVQYAPAGCSCETTVPVTAVKVELVLLNAGTVTPAPENSTHDADVRASGGADGLGPLPMGQGRRDF